MIIDEFLDEVKKGIDCIDKNTVLEMSLILKGASRIFFIGSGGGAGHASHACCDFRKLCEIESYAPYDNITELTARTNDEGYASTIIEYLKVSNFNKNDCLFVFSVGGGQKGVSENLTNAMEYAHEMKADIVGITAYRGSVLHKLASSCIIIDSDFTTPITEGLQSVVWHLLVTILQKNKTVW